MSFVATVLSLILGQRYRRYRTQSVGGETAPLLDADTEEDSFVAAPTASRPPTVAGGGGSPEEETVPIEDIMRRRSIPNGGDGGGGGRRRYRCDTEHREYCTDLINCYDTPPAEDAMEAQAGDRGEGGGGGGGCRRRRDEDEAQTLRHMMLLVLLTISMFIGNLINFSIY